MDDREGTSGTTVAVVYNPVRVDVPRVRAAVEARAAQEGDIELLWLETTPEDGGQGQTRQALERGATLVLAAGGDGTVRAVAEALRDQDATLGLLPGGTGNLLARNIGVPFTGVEEAVAVAFDGVTRRIDIGLVTAERHDGSRSEHAFLVMAGVGFDARMIETTRPELKRRFGWLAYVESAFRSWPRSRKVRLRFGIDDDPERTAHVSTILFANCGSLPGNMQLIPDSEVDDGLIDIAILQPVTVFGWLTIWRKVTWENRVLHRSALGRRIIRFTDKAIRTRLSYLRGATVTVVLDEPEPFELDGDGFGEVIALEIGLDPQGLRVRVPR
ncbi:diacylglycerol kinase family protein [Leifsonia sp. EB34]|uniref:diacylglycerol/lipid kinase family protein n=1 Tax=Leifsonia sp. EB34 TaxID=3156303 RepID=UPI003514FE18